MKKNILFNRAMNYIFVLIGLYGMTEIFLSAFELELLNGMYIIVLAVLCLMMYFVNIYFSINTYRGFLIVLIMIWGMIGFLLKSFLKFSLYGLINYDMELGINYENSLAPDLFIIYNFTIIYILYIYFYFREKRMVYIILPIPIIVAFLFNRIPSAVSITFIIISIICSSLYKNIEGSDKRLIYPIGVAIVICLLLIVAELAVPQKEYDNSGGFIIKLINRLEDKEAEKEQTLIAAGGISGGVLGKYDEIQYKNVKMMTLITGYTGDIYLRSFVGAVYNQNSWDKLPDNIYSDNKKLFDGSIYNIDAYNQQANLYTLIGQDRELVAYMYGNFENYFNKVGNRKYYVNLEPITDKNYWYIPYGNGYFVSNKSAPDSYPLDFSEGKIAGKQYYEKDIDYDKMTSLIDAYDGTNFKFNQYINWEKQYREFVYNNYTNKFADYSSYVLSARVQIPEFYGNIHSAADKLSFANCLKSYFEENFKYSLVTGALKENEDFVKKFLAHDTDGYCTHFASAAVIIMRNAGIPARYVEGYHIQSNYSVAQGVKECTDIFENINFEVENKYNLYTINVFDTDAHAWIEIYMDGYGWMPLEFTPGYTSNANMENGTILIKEESQNENIEYMPKEDINQDLELAYEPTKYDTIEEYMKHNPTNRIDFSIVLPIIGKQLLKLLFYFFLCVMFLCMIAICFYIPAKYLEIKKRSLFTMNENNTPKDDEWQVIEAYQYIDKICRFLKINHTKDMTCATLAKKCIQYDEFFKEAHIENVMYAIEKVSFGHGNISKAEMKNTVDTIGKIHDACYQKQGRLGKILFRYIWHLY